MTQPTVERPDVQAAPPRGRSVAHLVLGTIFVVIGVFWLLDVLDVAAFSWPGLLAAALIVTGVGAIVASRTQSANGLVALGIVLSIAVVVASALNFDVRASLEVGDRNIRPSTVADVESEYVFGIGEFQLDLRALDLPAGTEISVRQAIGKMTILLPSDAAAAVESRVTIGNSRVFGEEQGGISVHHKNEVGPTTERVMLDLKLGIGEVEVRR